MSNEVSQNKVMFKRSTGYLATHKNVDIIGSVLFDAALVIAHRLGLKDLRISKRSKTWAIGATIVGTIAAAILAGSMLGIEGAIAIVIWDGIALGSSIFLGKASTNTL